MNVYVGLVFEREITIKKQIHVFPKIILIKVIDIYKIYHKYTRCQ